MYEHIDMNSLYFECLQSGEQSKDFGWGYLSP